MKLLLVHSYYQQRGGEDAVFEAEAEALRDAGHEVETFVMHNAEYAKLAKWKQLLAVFWNTKAFNDVQRKIKQFKPQVMHVHNVFPFLSPSVLWAAKQMRVPVVATLHNYRLMCANGLFYRAGGACERCVGKFIPLPAITYGCYRGSRIQSAFVVYSMVMHRLVGSWNIPRTFIAPTPFAAEKFSSIVPKNRIRIKPHFAEDVLLPVQQKNGRAIFVGRLSEEKGIDWLLDAWRGMKADMKLDIVGEGDVRSDDPRITFHKFVEPEQLRMMLAQSAITIVPSRCYETFSKIVVESFAAGTAVMAASDTAPASLIEEGKTGAVFARDDVEGFLKLVASYIENPKQAAEQGAHARAAYLEKYQAQKNVEMLLTIYKSL